MLFLSFGLCCMWGFFMAMWGWGDIQLLKASPVPHTTCNFKPFIPPAER